MKKQYTIIVLLLIWTGIMIAKPIIEALPTPEQKEYEAYMHEMSEKSRAVEEQFDGMVTYCKEHEEALMKVSEEFLEQYHEDITLQETARIAQNNTSPEWTELSPKLTLEYPDSARLGGKCVSYFCARGGACLLYVVYFADEDEVYRFDINGHQWGREEKINDNLYVCIFEFQLI